MSQVAVRTGPNSPLAPQPSLWDTLTRRTARPPASRRARRVADAPTQPLSPLPTKVATPASQPLRLGPPWPERDVLLAVEGDTTAAQRRFSFRRALWCGAQCYVLLAPWESRGDQMAALVSVGIERVRVLGRAANAEINGSRDV